MEARKNQYCRKSLGDRIFTWALPIIAAFIGWLSWQSFGLPAMSCWGLALSLSLACLTIVLAGLWFRQANPSLSRIYWRLNYMAVKTGKLLVIITAAGARAFAVMISALNFSALNPFPEQLRVKSWKEPAETPAGKHLYVTYRGGKTTDYGSVPAPQPPSWQPIK